MGALAVHPPSDQLHAGYACRRRVAAVSLAQPVLPYCETAGLHALRFAMEAEKLSARHERSVALLAWALQTWACGR